MDDEKIMQIAEPFLKPVGDHWCFENAIRDNGDIEDFAKALLAAKDQRIAALKAENARLRAERVSDDWLSHYRDCCYSVISEFDTGGDSCREEHER